MTMLPFLYSCIMYYVLCIMYYYYNYMACFIHFLLIISCQASDLIIVRNLLLR